MTTSSEIKKLIKEFDELKYRFAHSGEPDHKLLRKFLKSSLTHIAKVAREEGSRGTWFIGNDDEE